jgi:3-dehydroquinate synthetase
VLRHVSARGRQLKIIGLRAMLNYGHKFARAYEALRGLRAICIAARPNGDWKTRRSAKLRSPRGKLASSTEDLNQWTAVHPLLLAGASANDKALIVTDSHVASTHAASAELSLSQARGVATA